LAILARILRRSRQEPTVDDDLLAELVAAVNRIAERLASSNVGDSNGEMAYIVDVIDRQARATELLSESVDEVARQIGEVASAIGSVAEALANLAVAQDSR